MVAIINLDERRQHRKVAHMIDDDGVNYEREINVEGTTIRVATHMDGRVTLCVDGVNVSAAWLETDGQLGAVIDALATARGVARDLRS